MMLYIILGLLGLIILLIWGLSRAWREIDDLYKQIDELTAEADELELIASDERQKTEYYKLIFHESEFEKFKKKGAVL